MRIKTGTCVGIGTAAIAAGSCFANDPSNQDLMDRIAELESRDSAQAETIQGLKRQLDTGAYQYEDNWLSETRSEEIRAMVQDVVGDADSRSSLLSEAGNAGWNNGFFLQSADGNFKLRVLGMIEFRHIMSSQDNAPSGPDTQNGFENTRTRIGFKGHVFDPSWSYFIWTTAGSTNSLLDAWIKKDMGNGFAIQAGQFKLPNWQEWVVSETRQSFIERSVLDARYRSLYSQGVQLYWKNDADNFRAQFAFSDGGQKGNTAWNGNAGNALWTGRTEYAFTGRAELKLGDESTWGQFADFESWTDGTQGFLLGGSLHMQDGEHGVAGTKNEIVQWSFDVAAEFGGASAFAAVIGTSVDDDASVDRDEFGFLLQGGFFLNDTWELMARYEYGDLDGAGSVGDDLSILTIGINKFWNRHGLKWTTDVGFAFDEVDAAWGGAGRGWRADAAGEDDQIVIRSQLNLLF